MKTLVAKLLVGLPTVACAFLAACQQTEESERAALATVKFRIVAEADERPLANRELHIFNGSVTHAVFDQVKTNALTRSYYLTSVKTDEQGRFALDLSHQQMKELTEIVIQPGPPHDVVGFERASDTRHTKSPYHVRVVQLKKETEEVARNDIYDLKQHLVVQEALDGLRNEAPFEEILLAARDLKKAAPARHSRRQTTDNEPTIP